MERKITGTLEVRIDSDGMEAKLVFTSDPEGTEYDVHGIIAFLENQRVKEGYNTASIDSLMPCFMKSQTGESVIETVARGTAPGNPVQEVFTWEECPIPSELKADAEYFFKKAPAPEFFNIRIDKIQKTKIVKEKKNPFLPAREKEVAYSIDKTVREPIGVNPTVKETGWADKGSVLASITPGVQGDDGIDVYGRPVLAVKPESDLVTGPLVERSEEVLVAAESGFIRRGDNWVELLTFKAHTWDFALSRDQNTVLLSFEPGEKSAAPPNPDLLIQGALALGVAEDSLIHSYELGTILHNSIESGKGISQIPVSTDLDGSFEITVSEDKLNAVLNMTKSRGRGEPLVLKEFGSALKEKKFKDIDYKKIQEDVLEYYRSKESVLTGYLLSEGEAPAPPGERKVDYTLNYMDEGDVESVKRTAASILSGENGERNFEGIESLENNPIDTVDKMAMVTSGMIIAEISQESGTPGKDVFGNKIEFSEVSDSGFRFLEGVERQGTRICTKAEGLLEQWNKPEGAVFRIRPHKNSLAEVRIAANRMSASITLHPSLGTGLPLSLESVRKQVEEKDVVFGINEDVLNRGVEHANGGDDIQDLVFANGKPPVNGEEAKLDFLISFSEDKAVTLKADGRADYRNQDHITLVKKGETIVKLIQSSIKAEEGEDVTGQKIPIRDVSQESLEAGDNIEQKEVKDGILYIASTGGEVIYANNRLSVHNIHIVKGSVGKESGNIKFSGTVKVGGYVQSGYVVMSQEDILVKDSVEASLLSAGGDIIIEKGIVGGDKAILRARKTIKASFAEQCTLLAIEDISFKRSCMRCSVKTNGKLNVLGDKGVILGGRIQTREGINTYNLGSEKEVKTMISFGQDYLIYDQIELEEKEVEKVKTRIAKLDLQLQKAEKQGIPEQIHKMRSEKLKMMKIIEKRSMRVLMLRERFEEHHTSELLVRGKVFPGVILESHGRTHEVKEESANVTFYFDLETGHIKMKKNKEN